MTVAQPNRTIIMPQIPEGLREDPANEQYFVELERILVEMFGGDQQIAGNLEIGGDLTVLGSANFFGGIRYKTDVITGDTTLDETYYTVYCNTDGGAFTLTLPAAPALGQTYRIINTGSAGNILTIDENGLPLLGETTTITLDYQDVIILTYETTEGWW